MKTPQKNFIVLLILCYMVVLTHCQTINRFQYSGQNVQNSHLNSLQKTSVSPSRQLQYVSSDKTQQTALFEQLLSEINGIRKNNNDQPLIKNPSWEVMIGQWAQTMQGRMSLVTYLQIYSINNFNLYSFASIQTDFIVEVVTTKCQACLNANAKEIAAHFQRIDSDKYQVFILIKGGSSSVDNKFTQADIEVLVQQIKGASRTTVEQDRDTTRLTLTVNVPTSGYQVPSQSNNNNGLVVNPFQIPSFSTTNPSAIVQDPYLLTPAPVPAVPTQSQNIAAPSYGPRQPTGPPQNPSVVVNPTPAIDPATVDDASLPLVAQNKFQFNQYYSGIIIEHQLPENLVQNQIFFVRGEIKTANPSGIRINVILTRSSDSQKLTFSQYLLANAKDFDIPVKPTLTGKFYISVFTGTIGYSSQQLYTVHPSYTGTIVSRPPVPVKAAYLRMKDNDLWASWLSNENTPTAITRLIFEQPNGQSVTYILSNYVKEFKVPYADFWFFSRGPTTLYVSQAFSTTESSYSRTSRFSAPYNIIFNATQHQYDITGKNNLSPIPFQVKQGTVLTINGTTANALQNEVFLVTPSQKFDTYLIDPSKGTHETLTIGSRVKFDLPFKQEGVYILQINDVSGAAAINVPVYSGNVLPLIPDFKDLSPSYYNRDALNYPQSLQERRKLVLDLINKVRAQYGSPAVVFDAKLNQLAQQYSQKMLSSNFFGHYDPEGTSPQDRAKAMGIEEGVGENLAFNSNLTEAQLMLERSPAHLRNMVKPQWTRVGLGIVQNPLGAYYLTQQFSSRDLTSQPLTSSQLQLIQDQVIAFLRQKYPFLTSEDNDLSTYLGDYHKMTEPPNLLSYLRMRGINRTIYIANIKVTYNGGDFMGLISSNSNFGINNKGFSKIGLSVKYVKGMLQCFGAFI